MTDILSDLDVPHALPSDDPQSGSLLERLRAQRAAAKPKTLDLVIPSWGADTGGISIIARFKRIPWRGSAATALRRLQTANASPQAELDAECDLLIAGLDELYAREPGSDDLAPLDDKQPMRFDQRTSDALGLSATKAREVVYAIYGGSTGEFALKAAAARYLQWLQGLEVVTEEEGNS